MTMPPGTQSAYSEACCMILVIDVAQTAVSDAKKSLEIMETSIRIVRGRFMAKGCENTLLMWAQLLESMETPPVVVVRFSIWFHMFILEARAEQFGMKGDELAVAISNQTVERTVPYAAVNSWLQIATFPFLKLASVCLRNGRSWQRCEGFHCTFFTNTKGADQRFRGYFAHTKGSANLCPPLKVPRFKRIVSQTLY